MYSFNNDEVSWHSPLEYKKWYRSTIGRWDLEKDEPIEYDANGNFIYPGLMDINEAIKFQCRKCRLQTKQCLALVKEGNLNEARKYVNVRNRDSKLENICTPFCGWYDYFEDKRRKVFVKYDQSKDKDLDREIDAL